MSENSNNLQEENNNLKNLLFKVKSENIQLKKGLVVLEERLFRIEYADEYQKDSQQIKGISKKK